MRKKLSLALVILVITSALAACGDTATSTTAPATTAAATTAAATTAAATTVAATTAAATTAAATTAAATTAATTTSATTAAATTAAATTAATGASLTNTELEPAPDLPALPAGAKKGGTLNMAVAGTLPATLPGNGGTADVVGNFLAMQPLLWSQGLVAYDYVNLKWYLEMAKDLKIDDSGKVFTFTLRPDLKWSDGSPITVDDFQYTFDNLSKPNKENPTAQYALLGNLVTLASYKTDPTAGTVTVTFNDVFARQVAYYYLSFQPVPKKTWGGKPFFDPANNPEIKKPSVTSGPYKIESYDPNSQAVLVANENWFKGRANFDKIILKPYAPDLVSEALKTGQADATLTYMPPSQYNDVKGNANLNTYDYSGVQVDFRYIVFNTTKPPFNDQALRQAIAYSLDRNTLIKLAENGRANPQFTNVNQNSPFYNGDVNHFDYSIDTAKKLLAGAGYNFQGNTLIGKDGQPVKFSLDYDNTDIPGKLVATYTQAQLKQIGIDVAVSGKDSQAYLVELITKKYDAGTGLTGGSVFPDPDATKFFYTKDGVFNTAGYVDPRIDEIFGLGAHELDNAKRTQLYQEFQKIYTTAMPSFVLYSKVNYIAANKKVGGIVPTKGGIVALNYAPATWYFTS